MTAETPRRPSLVNAVAARIQADAAKRAAAIAQARTILPRAHRTEQPTANAQQED
ncbi:hypothetical protein [Streptomyces sp. NPDC002758]